MAKVNRRLERELKGAESRLEAIGRRETWTLTPGEQVRLAALTALALSERPARAERAARGRAEIWETAADRCRREIAAARSELDKAAAEAAAARKGWW